MKIQKVKLSEIYPYYNNPRDNARAVAPVMESLKKFGFIKPIMVDKDMVIICGHTRYIAAFQCGCEYVPIVVSDMPDEQAKRFRILDNKIAEKSSFDEDELIEELKKLEAPKEMQAFFFEDIDMMINFSFDQFQRQAEKSGGFTEFNDTFAGGDETYSDEQGDYREDKVESYDLSQEQEEQESDEGLLFTKLTRNDGTHYMRVICPYCGNEEEIDLDVEEEE